jgi:hypothetical protein
LYRRNFQDGGKPGSPAEIANPLFTELKMELTRVLGAYGASIYGSPPDGAKLDSGKCTNAPERLKEVLDTFFPTLMDDLAKIKDHRASNIKHRLEEVLFFRMLSAIFMKDSMRYWLTSYRDRALTNNASYVLDRDINSIPSWDTICECMGSVPYAQIRHATNRICKTYLEKDWARSDRLILEESSQESQSGQESFLVFLDAVVVSDNNSDLKAGAERVPETVAVDAKLLIKNSVFSLATQFKQFEHDLDLEASRFAAFSARKEGKVQDDELSDEELAAFASRDLAVATLENLPIEAKKQCDASIAKLESAAFWKIEDEGNILKRVLAMANPKSVSYQNAQSRRDYRVEVIQDKLAAAVGELQDKLKLQLEKYERDLEKNLGALDRNLESAIKKVEEGYRGFQSIRQRRQFELGALPDILDQLSSTYPGSVFCFVLPFLDISTDAIKDIISHGYHYIVMEHTAKIPDLAQALDKDSSGQVKDHAIEKPALSWANGLDYAGLSVNIAHSSEAEKSPFLFATDLAISSEEDCSKIIQAAMNRFLVEKESFKIQQSLGFDTDHKLYNAKACSSNFGCIQLAYAISQILLATDWNVSSGAISERAYIESFTRYMHK